MSQPALFTPPPIPCFDKSEQNIFPVIVNPALAGDFRQFAAAVSTDMLYGMQELRAFKAVGILPIREGVVSGYLIQNGHKDFSISSVACQYARVLSADTYVGMVFGHRQHRYLGYAPINAWYAGIGANTKFSSKWKTGLMLFASQHPHGNIWQWPAYNLELGYIITPQFQLSGYIEKNIESASVAYLQMYYSVRKKWGIGIMGCPNFSIIGCQIHFLFTSLSIGFSVLVHPYLGTSPGIMLMTKPN